MNVGIDARKYFDFGIGTYIRNLASYFDTLGQDRFTYFAAPEDAGEIRRTHRGETVVSRSAKYSAGELVSLSLQAHRARVSLYHAPHYTLPYGLSMPSVVTIHDVIHLRFPEYFSPIQRAYARFMITHACRAADAVIVDSEFSGRELLRHVTCPQGKIHVIHPGVSGRFMPGGGFGVTDVFTRKYRLGKKFVLYVGGIKPHKNVPCLLRAFAGLGGEQDLQIVFIGERPEEDAGLRALCTQWGIADRVKSLGWLPEDDLITAYRAAAVVVLPSLYEGFGFPVLEAMACGTPVIGSNAASIPEVIGDAGVLFDPFSDRDLTEAIRSVLSDRSLRDTLREKGLRRAKLFTWNRCGEMTINLYRSVE